MSAVCYGKLSTVQSATALGGRSYIFRKGILFRHFKGLCNHFSSELLFLILYCHCIVLHNPEGQKKEKLTPIGYSCVYTFHLALIN